ncbi:hypothetical protein BSZ39_12670 [Bowdeniella nasicola]|uniref:Extracellular solute-binding protein, family 5 Middle n=2 Tax=Bowdeniella nasicola TaxID=208480 RepID=A0A1Q5PWH3_9ACTO|nr:hypothetical protein BSZ39_12670 [Bowdeniella nasicola]
MLIPNTPARSACPHSTLKSRFTLLFNAKDQLRSDLSLTAAQQAKEFGIDIKAVGTTWDEIYKLGKSNAVMWGGGRHHPGQIYTFYSSKAWNVGYNNIAQYGNPKVDEYLEKALHSRSQDEANEWWKKAQWDGSTGFATSADAPLIWLVSLDHVYYVKNDLDLGTQPLQSHGHEWQLFGNIATWRLKG